MHLDLTLLRLESAPFRLRQFISINLEEWVNETIIESIKYVARSNNMPSRYLESIKWVRKGELSGEVVLDYFGTKGEPLGKWFELGTKPHKILPVMAKALRWISGISKAQQFAKIKTSKGTGFPVYAMKVNHPGTKAWHTMERGVELGMPKLERKIIDETNQFLQESKMT